MDCRVKPGNDDGWVQAALKSRTPLCFRRNDEGKSNSSLLPFWMVNKLEISVRTIS